MANIRLQSLMQKEVSRKEFLGLFVLAVCSIFGFGHILKLLTGKSLESHKALQDMGERGAYGGGK